MDEILTVQEVANYLKMSRSTIWRWCNKGTLPAFKVGRSWRIRRIIVERLTVQQAAQTILTNQKAGDEHERFQ